MVAAAQAGLLPAVPAAHSTVAIAAPAYAAHAYAAPAYAAPAYAAPALLKAAPIAAPAIVKAAAPSVDYFVSNPRGFYTVPKSLLH